MKPGVIINVKNHPSEMGGMISLAMTLRDF